VSKSILIITGLFAAFTGSGEYPDKMSTETSVLTENIMQVKARSSFPWLGAFMIVSPVLGNSRSLNPALEEDVLQIAGSEANSSNGSSEKPSLRKSQEQNWGLAAGLRVARIPFDIEEDTVTNFIPQLFFENDLIFLRGLEGGIKITGDDVWQLNAQ